MEFNFEFDPEKSEANKVKLALILSRPKRSGLMGMFSSFQLALNMKGAGMRLRFIVIDVGQQFLPGAKKPFD